MNDSTPRRTAPRSRYCDRVQIGFSVDRAVRNLATTVTPEDPCASSFWV